MNILKNSIIAKLYNISRPTVGKWITGAKNKENILELVTIDGVEYIIDNENNRKEIENLKMKGQKYRNKIGYELLVPDNRIYKIFTESQIIEIITNLETNKIIPLKYTYFDKGAQMWNDYVITDINDPKYSYNKKEEVLIKTSLDFLELKLQNFEKVNIIDVGPGNGYVSKGVIDKLISIDKLAKYTGIDISPSIIELLKKNISNWYPNINASYQISDIDFEIIRDLLFFNKHEDSSNSCNLILFFGSTIGNFYDRNRIYKNFYDSMGINDFLWLNSGLESPGEIEAIKKHAKKPAIIEESSWIPNYLSLREDLYSVDVKFNTLINSYTLIFKLNKDVDIKFTLKGHDKIVSLRQNDEIIVWNYHSYNIETFISEIQNVGFTIANQTCYPDYSDAFILCEIKNN